MPFLVSAVGAGVGRLQVANTAALLVTMVLHNRLAIVGDNVLRRGVGRLVHLAQAAAVNRWTWTEVGSVADEIMVVTVNPAESQEIWIFSSAIAVVVEGLPFTTVVKLGSLQLLHWVALRGGLDNTNETEIARNH